MQQKATTCPKSQSNHCRRATDLLWPRLITLIANYRD